MSDFLRYIDLYSQNEVYYSQLEERCMTKEEKLDKITKDFSMLPDDKQDQILGILQALAYANDMENEENVPSDLEQNRESI